MPERGERRHAGRQDERAEPEARDQAAEVGGVVDRTARGEPEREVDQDQHPELADQRPALAVDRVMEPAGGQQDPEQPEDRAGCANRRNVATEHEARGRPCRRTGQVEGQEPDATVPALDDRAGQPQGVHVEQQVEQVAVQERHRPEAPVLPAATAGLSSWSRS